MNIITKIVKNILGERRFELNRRAEKSKYKKRNRRKKQRRKK